jgi:hypothetical protein
VGETCGVGCPLKWRAPVRSAKKRIAEGVDRTRRLLAARSQTHYINKTVRDGKVASTSGVALAAKDRASSESVNRQRAFCAAPSAPWLDPSLLSNTPF